MGVYSDNMISENLVSVCLKQTSLTNYPSSLTVHDADEHERSHYNIHYPWISF